MIYLDWASTSPPDRAILLEAAELAAACYGNPSSTHRLGTEARAKLEEARSRLALCLHATKEAARGCIVFTSGGSEANAIALLATLRKRSHARAAPLHIVASAIEHAAIHEQLRLLAGLGVETSFVRPGANGLVTPEAVAAAIRKETALVTVMAVNNETGAIQPLGDIVRAVACAARELGRATPPRVHADAVQAFGKIPFDPLKLGLSSAAFSAHKLRGPRGTGAMWLAATLEPFVVGGGQEGGIRPGTENLAGAWAFSNVAEQAVTSLASELQHARELEARLIAGMEAIPGAIVLPFGRKAGDTRYSPYILSASFPGLAGEVLARALSDEGIAVSTGSACASNAHAKERRVLAAMGVPPELSFGAIRISTGTLTLPADVDRFLETAARVYTRLKP